jgi:hypothetical protein
VVGNLDVGLAGAEVGIGEHGSRAVDRGDRCVGLLETMRTSAMSQPIVALPLTSDFAITVRSTSLVPSPIAISGASR